MVSFLIVQKLSKEQTSVVEVCSFFCFCKKIVIKIVFWKKIQKNNQIFLHSTNELRYVEVDTYLGGET